MAGSSELDALGRGFRSRYLDYSDLTAQLEAWAKAFPEIVRLGSIGTTEEGRDLWLLTLGRDPDRIRPAAWVDGNMHAVELCGSSVALAIAEDVIRLHVDQDAAVGELPPHLRRQLRETLFYILPRMSPDGAEAVLKTGRYVRSVPRDTRPNKGRVRWVSGDVDGDGEALSMRMEDPTGELVESSHVPGLMLPRRLEDEGPFYRVFPEGMIEHWDGHTIPDPGYLNDNEPDLNRNFPYSWHPEPEQAGAGRFPASEPESRAVVEFATAHPNIFTWANMHTFGGVLIRPLGSAPDGKMNQGDLALYRQLEEWATRYTGYATVSGYEEFTYEPDKPIHGDLSDFAYHHRGCLAWVCELWDLFDQVGFPREKKYIDRYMRRTREDTEKLARWDAEHNQGRSFRPWRPFDHPQLGAVELGGVDRRVGLNNPPYEKIDEICRGQTATKLRVAAMVPRLTVRHTGTTKVDGQVSMVEILVENHGYMATYGIPSAKDHPWNEPLYAVAEPQSGDIAILGETRREVGHLDGWGRGLFSGLNLPYVPNTRGNGASHALRLAVQGRGQLGVRVGSCRTGFIDAKVEV